ncbi:unknow [Vibrio campbellii]|nr:unknow [Vibrio campbellii]
MDEAIEIFEKYCNGGLSILMSWLIASGNEPSILLNKLLESEASLKSDLVDLDMDDF